MSESPSEWYARVKAALDTDGHRDSDWSQWAVWPFAADGTVKPLDPPADAEPERRGHDGVDCGSCATSRDLPADHIAWYDDQWMLGVGESSLPFAMFLMPRRHADLADLTASEAARQGELLAAIERAATATASVPRIQVARWGDGGEHLHWWLYARPTGMLQLRGTFLSHWDDLLPLRDTDAARADAQRLAEALAADAGGTVNPAP